MAIQGSGRDVRCARLQLQPGEQGREVAVPIAAAVLVVAAAAHVGSTMPTSSIGQQCVASRSRGIGCNCACRTVDARCTHHLSARPHRRHTPRWSRPHSTVRLEASARSRCSACPCTTPPSTTPSTGTHATAWRARTAQRRLKRIGRFGWHGTSRAACCTRRQCGEANDE